MTGNDPHIGKDPQHENGQSGGPIPHRLFGKGEYLELVEVDASPGQVTQTARTAGLGRQTAVRLGRMAEDRAALTELDGFAAPAGFFQEAYEAASAAREREALFGTGDGSLSREEMRESAVLPASGVGGSLATRVARAIERSAIGRRVGAAVPGARAARAFATQHRVVSMAALVLLSLGGLTLYLAVTLMPEGSPGDGTAVASGSGDAETGVDVGRSGNVLALESSDNVGLGALVQSDRESDREVGGATPDAVDGEPAGDAELADADNGTEPAIIDSDDGPVVAAGDAESPTGPVTLTEVAGLFEAFEAAGDGLLVVRVRPAIGDAGDAVRGRAGGDVMDLIVGAGRQSWAYLGSAGESAAVVLPGYRVAFLGLRADGSPVAPALGGGPGDGRHEGRNDAVRVDPNPEVLSVALGRRATSLAGLRRALRDAGYEVSFAAADRAVAVDTEDGRVDAAWDEAETGGDGQPMPRGPRVLVVVEADRI